MNGTIFKVTLSGTITTLYKFCSQPKCADGLISFAGLTLGTDGNFYGTTSEGGAYNGGTVFKVTPQGSLTTLHSFQPATDGSVSSGNLVQGIGGEFFGTTEYGGAYGHGTVFKIAPLGELTTIYDFCSQPSCSDGDVAVGGLVQGPDGNFYGATQEGGIVPPTGNCGTFYGCGTIFSITPTGAYTVLHAFDGTDGDAPYNGLIAAADGYLYGTTAGGGAYDLGTVFKITPQGAFTSLFSFDDTPGAIPWASLVEANDGKFYGTTYYNIAGGSSTIFQIASDGALTTLHNFIRLEAHTLIGLVQGTDGAFYGSNAAIFRLSMGLPPIVKTVPLMGPVGTQVIILGTNLTGATSVDFNGIPTDFTVVSATEITASVPAGASTGKVQVTTPGGRLLTVGGFVVTP